MRRINKCCLVGALIAVSSLIQEKGATMAAKGNTPHFVSSDDIVLQWNEIAVTTIGGHPPSPSTRFMATVQLAVFEAVNSISGKYEPYLGTIPAPASASTAAAA